MEGGGIEIGSVRPNERVGFGIDSDLVEQMQVIQWSVQLARQDRPELDGLLSRIIKTDTKCIRGNDGERLDLVNWVFESRRPVPRYAVAGFTSRIRFRMSSELSRSDSAWKFSRIL